MPLSHPNLDLAVLLAHFVGGERFGCGAAQNGPEVMSYLEPWHGHIKVVPVSIPDESGQPSCLHRSSNAYSSPLARV